MKTQFDLFLIRHGATKSNQERRYLGKTDEFLSEEGIQQLNGNSKLDYYPPVDIVFSSPMARCQETAKLLYPDLQPILISEWKEIDFGDFEGKNHRELKNDLRYQAWIDSNGRLPFPNGESREDFIARSITGFKKMLKYLRETEETAVSAIVHGGTIMAILSVFGNGDYYDYQVGNGEGYRCKIDCCEKPENISNIVSIIDEKYQK